MKWLILLILLLVLFAIVAMRYKKQIQTALYVWKMFKRVRQMNRTEEKRIEKKEPAEATNLIRCAKCGSWFPQQNALNLRSKAYFCSTVCMEKAAKVS